MGLCALVVDKGGKGCALLLFGHVAVVGAGDRGHRHRVQNGEGSEGNTEAVSGVRGTVAHSAPLSPPATAPARCLQKWPHELERAQML